MSKIIGMIPGTGKQSKGIALRLGQAGYEVMIGSRSKEKAQLVSEELNKKLNSNKFKGERNIDIAKKCNLIFLVVPYEFLLESLKELVPFFKPGTILVDVIVPLMFQGGLVRCPEDLTYNSVSEQIQAFVGSKIIVVGAFKTISAHLLNDVKNPLDVDIFLTADNNEIKDDLKNYFSKINGIRILDGGPLAFSHITEEMTAFVINLNKLNDLKHASFKIISSKRD